MLPAGQKKHNDEDFNQDDSDDSDSKPTKRSGRRKIKIEYIEDKNRRHITFSKRKAGIMKKAYELSTLTGTQVLLLVVSETGLVYTFTTTKLQPIVTKPEGKNLIQNCLNTPDPTVPETNTDIQTEETSSSNNNFSAARPQQQQQQQQQQQHQQQVEASNASSVTTSVVNRMPEDSKNPLSPQTAASHSPMMQSSPLVIRQSNMIPPVNNAPSGPNAGNPPSNPQSSNMPYANQPPQMAMPPYSQQPRYPNYNNGSLPQPYQQAYGQQPYYHQSQQPAYSQGSGLPSLPHSQHQPQNAGGYWSYNGDQQQGNNGGNPANANRGSNIKQE